MNNQHTAELRKKYILHPPEGMTTEDVRTMSNNALLDMDYFLHEDDEFDDDFGEEGFTYSKSPSSLHAHFHVDFFSRVLRKENSPIK